MRMEGHFQTVSAIKDAVIAGDLDTAREMAAVLTQREATTQRPIDWQPHVSDLVAAARAAENASDLEAASKATALMGSSCGTCHQAVGAKPVVDHGIEPEEGESRAARMQRHKWGVDRMWEGLVLPSEDSWQWGAQTIGDTPGCSEEGEETEYLQALCEKVDALGRSALDARDQADRTRIYGEFLTTCSTCHTQIQKASTQTP